MHFTVPLISDKNSVNNVNVFFSFFSDQFWTSGFVNFRLPRLRILGYITRIGKINCVMWRNTITFKVLRDSSIFKVFAFFTAQCKAGISDISKWNEIIIYISVNYYIFIITSFIGNIFLQKGVSRINLVRLYL